MLSKEANSPQQDSDKMVADGFSIQFIRGENRD